MAHKLTTKSKPSPLAKSAPAKSKTLAASQMSKGVPKAGATPPHQKISVRQKTARGN